MNWSARLADRIILDDRFNTIDVDLVQALLYLQCNDPRIKARVLKYLRCEDLTEHDRRLLGGIVPCTYADAPHWIIQRLGELIWAVEKVPLILCVDQLEDIFDLDEAAIKFRRAMATLCDIVSRLPSAIVVIACLDDFYDELKKLLTRPIVDRVENDPPPVDLTAPCDRDEVEKLIGQRLKFLYESMDVPFQPDQPTYPLPDALVRKLVGLRARDVLGEVQVYRERCIAKGKMAEYPFEGGSSARSERRNQQIIPLEQAWNEFRSTFDDRGPVDEAELAAILAEAIGPCSDEVETGEHFEAESRRPDGRRSSAMPSDNSVERMLVGVCNKGPQGGALGRQIDEVVKRAGEHTPVIVRSTDFPSNPESGGLAAARQVDHRRRPSRGRRGLGLADDDGAGRVSDRTRDRRRPELRGLAQADPPLDQPHVAADDPGPGPIGSSRADDRRRRPARSRPDDASPVDDAPTVNARAAPRAASIASSSARPTTAAASR